MNRIAGDIAALAFIGLLIIGGFHLLTGVAEAGSWSRFVNYNGTDSTAEWIESLRYTGGC